MAKDFNITGVCLPKEHYMVDVSAKMEEVMELVEKGRYFIINRPRQYGKTTTLFTIADTLDKTSNYLTFNVSFEGVGDMFFSSEEKFAKGFISVLAFYAKYRIKHLAEWLAEKKIQVQSFDDVSDAISELVDKADKKVVVLIDEVDKSSNNQLFISFLAMLRQKYLTRSVAPTFHSIVLAGVHDVKSLKLKLRPDEEQKLNSPWNIATDFKVDMNFYPHEIKPMLDEYAADKNVSMNTEGVSERLFYYTSGYPFLVSKLCKMLAEEIKPTGDWLVEDVETAVSQLVREKNTNFESLVKNLENNPELYKWVFHIMVEENRVGYSNFNLMTDLGILHGILAERDGAVVIHNRIYREVIWDYMREKIYVSHLANPEGIGFGYKNDDGTLNMEAVLFGFQNFMKKEYSRNDRDFLEKNGRLVFLAFIKPIINGGGYDFKEPQISEEKRLDVAITYLHEKFVAELKLWYGQKAHDKGLIQLSDYLDRQNLDAGYLVIFDHAKVKKWRSERYIINGKRILAVWV
jgi:hypothetical protein